MVDAEHKVFLLGKDKTALLPIHVMGRMEDIAVPSLYWIDFAADTFAGGEGSPESPYMIKTPEQLARVAKLTNMEELIPGKNFKLMNDIDLAGKYWTSIGSEKPNGRFVGMFDGNHKSISNLTSAAKIGESFKGNGARESRGLFSSVIDTEIKDLNIHNANIVSRKRIGVLAAVASNSQISFCSVSGNIYGGDVGIMGEYLFANELGGLLGSSFSSRIRNSYASVNVQGHDDIGGLVGHSKESKFSDSQVIGKIKIIGNWNMDVGPFVGKERSSDFVGVHVDEEVEVGRAYENNDSFY